MLVEITVKVPAEVAPEIRALAEKLAKMHVAGSDEAELPLERLDWCMAQAINELIKDKVIRSSRDYTYIMMIMNEEVVKGLPFFYSPMEFIAYLKALDFDSLPGKTTLYDTVNKTRGRYPNWFFDDNPKDMERMRRINIAKQFLSALGRAKRGMSEGLSEK